MPVRYRLIGVTFALSLLLYVDRVAISTARAPIASDLGLSDTQFGWALSAFALGYAVFQTPAGFFADRVGARVALSSVVTLWSLFTALTGLARGYMSLLVCRFLFGAGEAGAFPSCARAFYAWLPVSERGLAQGVNFSGSRLGAAFALPAMAWFIGVSGWRAAFALLGGAGLGFAILWWWWFRDTPEQHASAGVDERRLIDAVSGTMNMAGNLGSFITSLAFPYLLQWTGSPRPFFVLGAALNVGAAALWRRARPERAVEQR